MAEEKMTLPSRGWQAIYGERRFTVLLVYLILMLAVPPVLFGFGLAGVWFDGLTSLLTLAAVLSLCYESRQRWFALILGMPTIFFTLGGHAFSGTAVGARALFIGHLCAILFFFGAAALIVKSLFNKPSTSLDSIFGAVCGYLFVGLGWAVLYSMIESIQPGSFAISRSLVADDDSARPCGHVLTYFSFVTLTTVGYGDITPISAAARTFTWIEAITGQFYLAVIVAGLVSALVARNEQAENSST